jgi:glycine/D-amino acid oxidase-like deaminating enzyme
MGRKRLLSSGIDSSTPPGSNGHIVIVGAGVFGAWTAHHLLRAGHRVTLIDSYGPANARASSGDETRMIRGAYGKDTLYTRMALNSLPEWKALSDSAGLPIFITSGVLYFFRSEEPYFLDSLAAHSELGIQSETLTQQEMRRRFPMIDFEGVNYGLFEPAFGTLLARRAVQTRSPASFETAAPVAGTGHAAFAQLGALKQLALSNGEAIEADNFIFAAGSWLPKLFRDLLGRRIVDPPGSFLLPPPAGDPRFCGAMPCWSDFNGGDMFYGFRTSSRGSNSRTDRSPIRTQDRRPSEPPREHHSATALPLLKGAQLTNRGSAMRMAPAATS